jgi:hypothetical protein
MMSDGRPNFNKYSQELRDKLRAACDEEGLVIGGRGGREGGFLASIRAAVDAGEGNIAFVLLNAAEQWPKGGDQYKRLYELYLAVSQHNESARNREGHYELDRAQQDSVRRRMAKEKK